MYRSARRIGQAGILALVVGGLALTAGAALGAAKHKRKLTTTIRVVLLDQSGSTQVSAGTVKSRLGRGAALQKVTITGHPTPTTFTIKGTATDFEARGTIKISLKGTATVHPNGSVTSTGSGRYKGGTGRYKRAKGKFTFTGTIPPAVPGKPQVATGKTTGTISY
jgi:hypothetical protein